MSLNDPGQGRPPGPSRPMQPPVPPQTPQYAQPEVSMVPGSAPQYAPQEGLPQYPGYPMPGQMQPAPKTNLLSILAIIGGFVVAPAGVVLGIIGLNQIKRTGEGGKGLALTGIIVGGFFTLMSLLFYTLIFLGMAAGAGSYQAPSLKNPNPGVPFVEEDAKKDIQKDVKKAPVPTGSELAPGDTVTGEAGELPWDYYEEASSLWSHEILTIEAAPELDVKKFIEGDTKIADYDIYYITYESEYLSGEVSEFSAFYTNFKPARADGTILDDLYLNGVANCKPESVGKDFAEKGATIKNCMGVAVPKGSEAPSGIAWTAYDTPYDLYQGHPAYILK